MAAAQDDEGDHTDGSAWAEAKGDTRGWDSTQAMDILRRLNPITASPWSAIETAVCSICSGTR